MVFLPQTIAAVGPWSAAIENGNGAASQDDDYETVGPQVFRFEYWYLLKNGTLTDVPWDKDARPNQQTITTARVNGIDVPSLIGLTDIQAIAVAIAVIDPASRALISPSALLDLASDLDDFATAPGRGNGGAKKAGDIEGKWNQVLFGDPTDGDPPGIVNTGQTSSGPTSRVPPAAASAIRVYSRYFDLRIP